MYHCTWTRWLNALILLLLSWSAHSSPLKIGEGNTGISRISEAVISRAYEKIGVQIEISHLPLERQLTMTNNGDLDGTGARLSGLEKLYPNLVMVPAPAILSEPIVVFTKDKNFEVKGWESLSPYKIGTIFGFKAAGIYPAHLNVETADTIEQVLQKLEIGRTDIAIASETTGLSALRKLQNKDIRILQPPLLRLQLFIYINRKNIELLPKLDKALREMALSGELQTLIDSEKAKLDR